MWPRKLWQAAGQTGPGSVAVRPAGKWGRGAGETDQRGRGRGTTLTSEAQGGSHRVLSWVAGGPLPDAFPTGTRF